MKNEKTNKPVEVIRDGNLSASIWQKEGKNGAYYTATYAKSYKDDRGNYQNSHSFYGTDHLKLAELSKQVYQRERELYYLDKQQQRGHEPRGYDQRSPAQDRER